MKIIYSTPYQTFLTPIGNESISRLIVGRFNREGVGLLERDSQVTGFDVNELEEKWSFPVKDFAWKIVAASIGGFEEDLDDCDFDDRYYYRSDGTYEYNNGTEKCFSDDPEEVMGTWELREGDTQLHI